MNKNALIVVTNHSELGSSGKKTGWYLAEVSHVYWPLHNAGFSIDFASPEGGNAPVEKDSLKLDDPENQSFVHKFGLKEYLPTKAMRDVDPNKYQVIYFAGGHGTMWDFPDNREIQRVTSAVFENGGIVGAVCHGPSALINVKLTDNRYLVQDKKINSFTDAEEKEVKKDKIVPFMLETRLKERGARFEAGENWTDKVVTDGRLITGQNPQSASSLARAIIRTYEELQIEAAFRESTPDKTASSSL